MEEKYNLLKQETIELCIDVIQQYGYPTGKRRFYWAGGFSTLENTLSLLNRCGVKTNDFIFSQLMVGIYFTTVNFTLGWFP